MLDKYRGYADEMYAPLIQWYGLSIIKLFEEEGKQNYGAEIEFADNVLNFIKEREVKILSGLIKRK